MQFRGLALIAVMVGWAVDCRAADIPPNTDRAPPPVVASVPPPNSIFVFAGRMSTTDNWSTMIFNLNEPNRTVYWDNWIVGGAYARELWRPGLGLVFGVEIGIADRFGNYKECCTEPIPRGWVHSAELWAGFSIGHSGAVVAGLLIRPTLVVGLSAVTNSIGSEKSQALEKGVNNAPLLFYLGPELAISLVSHPNWEFVYRLQHRSGLYGTIGVLGEGYNANVFGVRYRF
jgi:hypothetical protein